MKALCNWVKSSAYNTTLLCYSSWYGIFLSTLKVFSRESLLEHYFEIKKWHWLYKQAVRENSKSFALLTKPHNLTTAYFSVVDAHGHKRFTASISPPLEYELTLGLALSKRMWHSVTSKQGCHRSSAPTCSEHFPHKETHSASTVPLCNIHPTRVRYPNIPQAHRLLTKHTGPTALASLLSRVLGGQVSSTAGFFLMFSLPEGISHLQTAPAVILPLWHIVLPYPPPWSTCHQLDLCASALLSRIQGTSVSLTLMWLPLLCLLPHARHSSTKTANCVQLPHIHGQFTRTSCGPVVCNHICKWQ